MILFRHKERQTGAKYVSLELTRSGKLGANKSALLFSTSTFLIKEGQKLAVIIYIRAETDSAEFESGFAKSSTTSVVN